MSPINGLTNQQQGFFKLGTIRKGAPKTGNAPGKDLDHFRVTFLPGKTANALEQAFLATYGANPTEINVRFPDSAVSKVWDANYEAYRQGSLVAKAASYEDGLRWIFYRHPETSEVLVRNGSPVGAEGRAFFDKEFDETMPVYFTKTNNEPVYLEPVGRLQVVIPELANIEVGYFEFQPKSPKDIGNISRELGTFADFAKAYGKTINGVPFKLIRRLEQVTKNIKGVLSIGPSWVCHLTAGGEWGRKAIEAIERLALPEVIDADVYVDAEARDVEDDFPEFPAEPDPEPAPAAKSPKPDARGFVKHPAPALPQPKDNEQDEMIDPMAASSVKYAAEAWNISPRDAAKAIASKNLGGSISKKAFEQLVNG